MSEEEFRRDGRDGAGRADALVCQAAARLVRASRAAALPIDVALGVDRLLDAVGRGIEADAGGVSPEVRRAAVGLAEHLVRRVPIAVPRGESCAVREGVEHPRPASAHPDRRSVPFCRSVRLGRMG